jgi:elongation factor Ts
MAVTAAMVKEVRERSGAGMLDCKKALDETNGDIDKALDLLREKGLAAAANKAGRIATEGAVGSYIHAGGRIGVLVEVNCETDFVAKTDEFKEFVKDIAMQISASNPRYVRR